MPESGRRQYRAGVLCPPRNREDAINTAPIQMTVNVQLDRMKAGAVIPLSFHFGDAYILSPNGNVFAPATLVSGEMVIVED